MKLLVPRSIYAVSPKIPLSIIFCTSFLTCLRVTSDAAASLYRFMLSLFPIIALIRSYLTSRFFMKFAPTNSPADTSIAGKENVRKFVRDLTPNSEKADITVLIIPRTVVTV